MYSTELEKHSKGCKEFLKKFKRLWDEPAAPRRKVRKLVRPDIIATEDGTNLKVKRAYINNTQRQFAEAVVMVVDSEGRGRMLRALFDSGCSKSIILKKFTESKQRTKLKPRDHIRYTTYGGTFNSTAKASVGLQFIEFEEKGK